MGAGPHHTEVITGRVVAVLGAAAALLTAAGTPAAGAPPAGLCQNADPARPVVRRLPWAQQTLDLSRTWRHSTGAGVVVAVVDSGVDSDHPQLRGGGKVLDGRNLVEPGDLPATFDCDSHGTAVASIIAARATKGVGFRGVAPDAVVLPVRIAERAVVDGQAERIESAVVAQAIRYATEQGAKVINLSLSSRRDHAVIREAIADAQSQDVVIVASVGNDQDDQRTHLRSYPAAYKGVLGVGAIDANGVRLSSSQLGTYVDLSAPGGVVVGATRRAGHTYYSGTSFAAPFVAGTAALVRAAYPNLTADQVARRLVATASPARGGSDEFAYGAGVVDPYRAVTEGLDAAPPAALAPAVRPTPDKVEQARMALQERRISTAFVSTGIALLLAALVMVASAVARRGRRQRWIATRAAEPSAQRDKEEPPDQLFLFPPPKAES